MTKIRKYVFDPVDDILLHNHPHTESWIFDINKLSVLDPNILNTITMVKLEVEVKNEDSMLKTFQIYPDIFKNQDRGLGFEFTDQSFTATIIANSQSPDDKIFLLDTLKTYGKINVLIDVEPTCAIYLSKSSLSVSYDSTIPSPDNFDITWDLFFIEP